LGKPNKLRKNPQGINWEKVLKAKNMALCGKKRLIQEIGERTEWCNPKKML